MGPSPADPRGEPTKARVEALMAEAMQEAGASAGLLYLVPPGDRLVWLTLLSGVSRQIAAPWYRSPLETSTPVTDAMRLRRPVWLDSQEEVARHYPQLGLVLPYGFALAAVPLISGEKAWGGLALLWPVENPRHPGAHPRETVTEYCRRIALLLEQASADGHPVIPPEQPGYLPVMHDDAEPSRALAALGFTERLPMGCCALDLEGRLTFINSAGADLVGADAAFLAGRRPWEALPWLYAPVSEESYRAAVVSHRPTYFTAVRPAGEPLLFELYPDGSGISVHITPARHRTAAPQGQPSDAVGAMALYHLTHLAAALAEAATVQEVVAVVTDQIVPAFGPQGLVLMTVEEARWHVIGHRGHTARFVDGLDGTPSTARTPASDTRNTGNPLYFASRADLLRAYTDAPCEEDRNAWAFLPLTASGGRIGTLVLSYDRPRPFDPPKRALLASLAGLIAQALGRARLYGAQHTLARTLQTSLLPPALPRVPGMDVAARYQSAAHTMDIGGDFYDLIRTSTTATAVIGDVQGHNTAAAALMGQVRTAVHTAATAGTPPGELLAGTNRLLADLDTGLFTSCLVAQLDLARNTVSLATAGHPPPLLRHPDGTTEVLSLPPGILLGIDPVADYPTSDIVLPSDAVLLLYTDGLVEVPGADIDDTTEKLARHLAHTRVRDLDDLADGILRHAGRAKRNHDDVAILLIRPTRRADDPVRRPLRGRRGSAV